MTAFIVHGVTRRPLQSREIGPGRVARPQSPGPVHTANVECRACGCRWDASEGTRTGQFRLGLWPAVRVTCPGCLVEGYIPLAN